MSKYRKVININVSTHPNQYSSHHPGLKSVKTLIIFHFKLLKVSYLNFESWMGKILIVYYLISNSSHLRAMSDAQKHPHTIRSPLTIPSTGHSIMYPTLNVPLKWV